MNSIIREFQMKDIGQITRIWNEVVESGSAFPQIHELTKEDAPSFFSSQSFTGVAEDTDTHEIAGLYILHPNNIGRCGHIANASYAVRSSLRGQHIGERLVAHSLQKGKELGYKILQFNAVVSTNYGAIKLYKKLDFIQLGIVPDGYLHKNGTYQDILLFYHPL